MNETDRRTLLSAMAGGAAIAAMPVAIQRALALPARQATGTLQDVKHVVILMQENRSFDHYFGTLRGVRGFGDRHPIPLAGGRDVWRQSDGQREIPPFHLDTSKTDALRVPGTPHSYADAQAARAARAGGGAGPRGRGAGREAASPSQEGPAGAGLCTGAAGSLRAGAARTAPATAAARAVILLQRRKPAMAGLWRSRQPSLPI